MLPIKHIFSFTMLPFLSLAQHQLTAHISEVSSSNGKVLVAVYNTKESFLSFDEAYASNGADAQQGTTQVIFPNLAKGEYALAVYHDENGNGEMDTNWLGIPKEDVAFSKAKMKLFGPPSFEECAFTLDKDSEIDISLK